MAPVASAQEPGCTAAVTAGLQAWSSGKCLTSSVTRSPQAGCDSGRLCHNCASLRLKGSRYPEYTTTSTVAVRGPDAWVGEGVVAGAVSAFTAENTVPTVCGHRPGGRVSEASRASA